MMEGAAYSDSCVPGPRANWRALFPLQEENDLTVMTEAAVASLAASEMLAESEKGKVQASDSRFDSASMSFHANSTSHHHASIEALHSAPVSSEPVTLVDAARKLGSRRLVRSGKNTRSGG